MGRFEKGKSGNPKGRPNGTPNKATGSLRESVNKLLEDKFSQVEKDFDELPPRDRINVYLKLLEFSLPKQRQQGIEVEGGQEIKLPTIVFASQSRKEPEEMTDEELDTEIDRLERIRKAIMEPPGGGSIAGQ